jgi:ubiquinone/menaquinone biosynthesis C-methylase UbiE
MECLDVGCGGGHVSLLMASIVGSAGKVVGTDTGKEIIELAKQDAETAKLGNVKFVRQMPAETNGTKSTIWFMRAFSSRT